MNIEVTILISIFAFAVSFISAFTTLRRNHRKDITTETTQMTTVIVKLESISNDIKEVKNDLRDVKNDLRNHADRLVKVEQELEQLKRVVFSRESA